MVQMVFRGRSLEWSLLRKIVSVFDFDQVEHLYDMHTDDGAEWGLPVFDIQRGFWCTQSEVVGV